MDIEEIKEKVNDAAGEIGASGFEELVWMLRVCQEHGVEVSGFCIFESLYDYFHEVCAHAGLSYIDEGPVFSTYYDANMDGGENNYLVDMTEAEDLATILFWMDSLPAAVTREFQPVLERIERSLLPYTIEFFCGKAFLIVDSEESMGAFLWSAEKILEMYATLSSHQEQLMNFKKIVVKARRNRLLFRVYLDLAKRFEGNDLLKEKLLALLVEDPYRFYDLSIQCDALERILECISSSCVAEEHLRTAQDMLKAEAVAFKKSGWGRWLAASDYASIYREEVRRVLNAFKGQLYNLPLGKRKLLIEYFVYLLRIKRKEFFEFAKLNPLYGRYVFRGGHLFLDVQSTPSDTNGAVIKWGPRPLRYRGQIREGTTWFDIVPSEQSIEGWIKYNCKGVWVYGAISIPKLKLWIKCGRPDMYWEYPNRNLLRPSGEYCLILSEKVYSHGVGFAKTEKTRAIKAMLRKVRKKARRTNGRGHGGESVDSSS